MSTLITVMLFLALPAQLSADTTSGRRVQDERAAREECSAYSQAGMRECLAKKAHNSEGALRQVEEKTISALSEWDEDAKYIALSKEKLRAANAAFAHYREAQCAFAASLGGGAIGNALEIGRLACVVELNNRRVEQLRNVIEDFEKSLP